MNEPEITIEYSVIPVQKIVDMVITKVLNPNPIGQRGPTSSGFKKSAKIMETVVTGQGFGMISIRDIRDNPVAKAIYGCDFLVIDGGHRCRALRDFYMGKFAVLGKTFSMHEDLDLNTIMVPVAYYKCTSAQAAIVFKSINTTTPTNFMEMVMSNEESSAAEIIRRFVTLVPEYGNEIHPLFATGVKPNGAIFNMHFEGDLPNPRAKWYEWVSIAIIKSISGRVDAGQPAIEQLVEGEPEISDKTVKVVKKFFDACLGLRHYRGKKFNADIFSAFLIYYFDILADYDFTIDDQHEFYSSFMTAHSLLGGKNDRTYEMETLEFEGQHHYVKAFYRSNLKNWANAVAQLEVAELIRSESDRRGITPLVKKRSLTSTEREEKLAIAGGVCAIDGLPLLLADAVYAHDTPWSKGGVTSFDEGAMVRRCHNVDMGLMTLDQYRYLLKGMSDAKVA